MKSYDQLKQELYEMHSNWMWGTRSDVAVDELGPIHDLEDDNVISKLNQFVSSIGIREYLIPENAIDIMRRKLMLFGITFGEVDIVGESGEVESPIVQYGGEYGKNTDSAPDEIIDQKDSGRRILFTYEQTPGGTYTILSKIV